jgi:hypothetical protein
MVGAVNAIEMVDAPVDDTERFVGILGTDKVVADAYVGVDVPYEFVAVSPTV